MAAAALAAAAEAAAAVDAAVVETGGEFPLLPLLLFGVLDLVHSRIIFFFLSV